ncbi:MAG: glycosyltransferase family 9 protein [Candidatus Competibacteraceae bacterium]
MEECQRIAQTCGPWLINLCGQTAILDIPPLCEPARFIVANDTGTAHLAATTTVPMLVLCGPTNPRQGQPLGNNVDPANRPILHQLLSQGLFHTPAWRC